MSSINKKQHQKDYNNNLCIDCPYCGQDRPGHTCPNCRNDMEKDVCWKYGGYCKKCFIYFHEELPKIRGEKQKLGIKCECDESLCAKCLSINCKDDNCPTHTNEAKELWKKNNS